MVLNRVVCAPFEHLGDLGPLVVHDTVHQKQDPLFLLVPVDFLDAGVEVIVPALAALLAYSAIQVLRDQRPLLGAICHHQLEYSPVLLGRPGSLHIEWFALSSDSLLG